MPYYNRGSILLCPRCKSQWIGYSCNKERYCCLSCDWEMSQKCEVGDYDKLIQECISLSEDEFKEGGG